MRFPSVLFSFLSVLSAGAQSGNVSTPVLGFAFDSSRGAIRPLRGIPGAALVDDPLDSGFLVATAAISPDGAFALAASGESPLLRLVRLRDTGTGLPLPPAAGAPADRIVFSPSGRSAVLYRSQGVSQVLTGLPDHPEVRDLKLPSLAGTPAALAISDDGSLAAVSAGSGDTDPLWLVKADAVPLQLPLSGIAALAFRAGSHDLLSIAAAGGVSLARNPDADADYRTVYAGDAQTAGAFAVRFSADGTRAYTASTSGRLAVIDLDAGSAAAVECGCHPDALEPLALKNVFRLTSVSTSPVMLFDASTPDARVWFVPSANTARKEGSGQ